MNLMFVWQVATLFKKDHPHVISAHCIAHRLPLAASQAAPKVPQLQQVKAVLTQLFYYYQKSPVRTAGLNDHFGKILSILVICMCINEYFTLN